MENMNEGSMQLLCLLISPQGWGTLRLHSFTTTDGLLRDVHCASLVCVCVLVGFLGGLDQTHSCLLKRSHEYLAMNQAARLPLTWYSSQTICLINTEKCVCVCARAYMSVYACFWGSSLQMDWDLTGIPMSYYDGVMKSLPLTKIVFTLRRWLAVGVCVRLRANVHLNRVTSERRGTFFLVGACA